jgi:hypothetical protein
MTLTAHFKKIVSENGKFGFELELVHPDGFVMAEVGSPVHFTTEARARAIVDLAIETHRQSGKFPNLCAMTE